jgi:type III pantothenate kinase
MLLAIDIGNTNIKIGVFRGTEIIAHWRVLTERHKLADEYAVLIRNLFDLAQINVGDIHGCVLACVVPPLMMQFTQLCTKYLGINPIVVGPQVISGLTFDVENPDEMGSDRIANSLAATVMYGSPVIAIAFGTATTFDVVVDNVYVGGCIAPGLGISADALFSLAARLYQVELVRPPKVIARNTVHHMQAGVIIGYTGLVEGIVSRMHAELGTTCPVVVTGGLADVIAKETTIITAVEPNLTLNGLRMIFERNH